MIGDYTVLELLGQGGMGSVYRVRHPHTDEELALKLMRTSDTLSRHDLLRFKREFAVCSSLSHPGLVRVFELGMSDGQPFYTMELVRGQSLRNFRGDPEQLFEKLLESIVYIHRHGVLHRDLKPENVLVDESGTPRLLDFGLAKHHESISQEITQPGTVHYMAPEQINGAEVDFRADLYSLDIMLYEMATGRLPFERPELVATLAAILCDPPPPEPLESVSELSDDIHAPTPPRKNSLATSRGPTAPVSDASESQRCSLHINSRRFRLRSAA